MGNSVHNMPPTWTLDELRAADLGRAGVWATPSLAPLVASALPLPPVTLSDLEGLDSLLSESGAEPMIDEAKAAVRDAGRPRQLIIIPSIWGSGAEASPVIVLNRSGKKEIRVDAKFLPDRRVYWPELASTIPPLRARQACGDCWAHGLEGFLSPLADDSLRNELSELLREMLATPLGNDLHARTGSIWFSPVCASSAV